MATVVSFHAHPDDEAILTAGTLARAADAGHRVVVVFATRGERGEVPDGFLRPGEPLWRRRIQESMRAAQIVGAARVEYLGYRDSGMMGTADNDDVGCFWRAGVDDAAVRLAALLREERADVVTTYDATGLYGHPDHLRVHSVGAAAAALAGTPSVYEATLNRDRVSDSLLRAHATGIPLPAGLHPGNVGDFGLATETLTTSVDVSGVIERKRAAMAAHESQLADSGYFLSLPPREFAHAFGTEWFIRRGVPSDVLEPPSIVERAPRVRRAVRARTLTPATR